MVSKLRRYDMNKVMRLYCKLRLPDNRRRTYKRVKQAVESSGIRVVESHVSFEGLSMGGVILIDEDMDSRKRTIVLVHEWAHELLGHPAILRQHPSQRRDPFHSLVREIQAESVSYVVCRYLGIDNPYTQGSLLIRDVGPRFLKANKDEILQTSRVMVGELE